jgi:hypothetical protein
MKRIAVSLANSINGLNLRALTQSYKIVNVEPDKNNNVKSKNNPSGNPEATPITFIAADFISPHPYKYYHFSTSSILCYNRQILSSMFTGFQKYSATIRGI